MTHDDGDAHGTDAIGPWGEPTDNRLGLAFLVGFVVGTVLLGVVWTIVSVTGDSDDQEGTSSQAGIGGPFSASRSDAPLPEDSTQLESCTSAANALRAPLDMAVPAVDQWEVHVGAMNKLMVGAITLQQATAFWDQTRVGALRRIDRFHDALETLRQDGVTCPAPALLPRVAPVARPCARRVAAEMRALQAARISIATWAEHVRHMDMLRAGTMSPATATRLWLSFWQEGVRQLESYRAAARAAEHVGGCSTSATPDTRSSQSGHPSTHTGTSH